MPKFTFKRQRQEKCQKSSTNIGKKFFAEFLLSTYIIGPCPRENSCVRIHPILPSFWVKWVHKDQGDFPVRLLVFKDMPETIDGLIHLLKLIHR